MKNQYFGDKRDLLKFTLLEALLDDIPTVERLTCVWLLTPPSTNNDGNRHFRAHEAESALATFLRECVGTGRRDVRELARYMADRSALYVSFGDEPATYFTALSRNTYFASIPDSSLRRAVVFLDPDNGLEPRTTVTAAHLKYAELQSVFNRMDSGSIAVVYQHLPRQPAEQFWPRTRARVRAALDCPVGYVAAGDVGFFLALRDAAPAERVRSVLQDLEMAWPVALRISAPS